MGCCPSFTSRPRAPPRDSFPEEGAAFWRGQDREHYGIWRESLGTVSFISYFSPQEPHCDAMDMARIRGF